jgi:tetratricopeptide (TPR) repeat protein
MTKIPAAIKAYTRALHLNPDLVGTYSAKAHALRKLDGHAEALAEYDKALQFKPEDFFLPFFRANSLQELKRDEEAKVAYEQAQRVAPDPIFALQRMLASVPLKKEAPGQPGGDQPERQFNALRRGRRSKSRAGWIVF